MKERLLVTLLLLFAVGCGPLPLARDSGPLLTDRVPVTWEGEPPAELRRNLERFVDLAELVYRARFEWGRLPVRGIVFHDAHLLEATVAEGHSDALLGYVQGGVIHLPWRGMAPGRAIIHELHHVAEGRDRPGHAGHGWRVANHLGARWWAEFWLLP